MAIFVADPYSYVTQHSSFRIKEIKRREVETVQEWVQLTSPDQPDQHTRQFILQLQYHVRGTRGHFLLVDENGEVKTNGRGNDPRSFLNIIYDFLHNEYQIIGWGECYNQAILYMDGTQLRARIHDPAMYIEDENTKFYFMTNGGVPPYKIVSKTSGLPLQFDEQGNFSIDNQSSRSNELYLFKPMVVNTMKITSV